MMALKSESPGRHSLGNQKNKTTDGTNTGNVSQGATKINNAADGNGHREPPHNGRVNSHGNGSSPVALPRLNTPLEAALYYLDHDCFVIPCCTMTPEGKCTFRHVHKRPKDVGKMPICGQQWQRARLTREDIISWWTRYPTANVGVLLEPSHLMVIDLDSTDATEEASAKGLPPGPQVRAGRGTHHYYRNPKKIVGITTKKGDSKTIDVLSKLIVIGFGSMHRTGKRYELIGTWEEWPPEDPPGWAEELLRKSISNGTATATLPNDLPAVDLDSLGVSPRIQELIVKGKAEHGPEYPDRSEPLWAVVMALVEAGHNDATIASVLLNPAFTISAKPLQQGKKWTAEEIGRAKKKAASNEAAEEQHARLKTSPKQRQARDAEEHEQEEQTEGDDFDADVHAADDLDDADDLDGEVLPTTTRDFKLTDLGNGELFVFEHGKDFLYCSLWRKWLTWDSSRWQRDDGQALRKRGRATVRGMYAHAQRLTALIAKAETSAAKKKLLKKQTRLLAHAVKSENAMRMKQMLDLAQMDLTVMPEEFDTNLWALNVKNGTLDLQTGTLRPHARGDLITKYIPIVYDPLATCPQWLAFLDSIMDGNQEVIDFLRKAVGYCLTGDTREDCLFLLHGKGANGKSTLLSILLALLADYGNQAAFSTFLHQDRETVRNDLADLKGARLVVASEVEEGKRLSMAVVKTLTGQDSMKARFLFSENFQFIPQLKIWLAANYKPVIRGTDDGIWRRIRLIPFTQKFEGARKDRTMRAKLLAELPGILAWAVQGCLAWQKEGLPMPATVQEATDGYRAESDVIGAFLAESCIIAKNATVLTATLYDAYATWCTTGGEAVIPKRAFGILLLERGFTSDRGTGGVRVWKGVGLLTTENE